MSDRVLFTHEPINLGYDDLPTVTEESGRRYETPHNKKYPSITTVLSILSKDSIEAWKKRVGEVEANRVSKRASGRGTRVHESLEDYVNNMSWKEILDKYTPDVIQSILTVRDELDKNLGVVLGQELALYSDYLELAGRVDCVAYWNGKLSIIDYKTSRRMKQKKHIEAYFCQESAYAIMFEERTGLPIQQLVTVIAVDDMGGAPGCQVFVEKRDNWVKMLLETKEKYDEEQESRRIG